MTLSSGTELSSEFGTKTNCLIRKGLNVNAEDGKCAIEFKYVKRLDEPLLIKETFLKDSKLRGRFFHGLRLDERTSGMPFEANS